jgi:hypothetical protein
MVCGKLFHRKPSYIEKTKNITCSYECSYKLRKITYAGKNNPQYGRKGELSTNFVGEKRKSHGYWEIYNPNHPYNEGNRVLEHRLIAEEYLLDNINSINIDGKKYLKPEFVVHHIDFDKLNNNINNLCVMKKDDHSAMHISFKTIIRGDKGRIKDVKYDFDINNKNEIKEIFNNYLNDHDIYYHTIDKINIPKKYKGEN